MAENLDTRILGAVRFIDAIVRTPILDQLVVSAPGVKLIRNRSNLFVIVGAPGADAYTTTFKLPKPPPAPAVGSISVTLTVHDPSGRYLPRSATFSVPRDPDLASVANPNTLFLPVDVELFPSPTQPPRTGSAILRLSIKRSGTEQGLPFAYVRVRRSSDDTVLAFGAADERGEALILIPGIPVTTWGTTSTGAVTTTGLRAKIAAYFDAQAFDKSLGRYPDPTALEGKLSILSHSTDVEVDLTSGREVTRRIELTL